MGARKSVCPLPAQLLLLLRIDVYGPIATTAKRARPDGPFLGWKARITTVRISLNLLLGENFRVTRRYGKSAGFARMLQEYDAWNIN